MKPKNKIRVLVEQIFSTSDVRCDKGGCIHHGREVKCSVDLAWDRAEAEARHDVALERERDQQDYSEMYPTRNNDRDAGIATLPFLIALIVISVVAGSASKSEPTAASPPAAFAHPSIELIELNQIDRELAGEKK